MKLRSLTILLNIFFLIKKPRYIGYISKLSPEEKKSLIVKGVWKKGCPTPITQLVIITTSYWGFDNKPAIGKIMIHQDVANEILFVFNTLFTRKFPIRRMELVDNYQANDNISMSKDNTTGFNGRMIPHSSSWSEHAFGKAIDINPFENPEVRGGRVSPPKARKYKNRNINHKGMIRKNDIVYNAFRSIGWYWGGDWTALKDYQHFSKNGK